jgi:Flp pilus assembly protein TadD/mono/diheme cytochrome c family protein
MKRSDRCPVYGAMALTVFLFPHILAAADPAADQKSAVTFNLHVAPIIFQNCSGCHRSDGSAPFPLSNFVEVKKHAPEIVEVTQKHFMPPWLPEQGYGQFTGERRLTSEQINILSLWVSSGMVEGEAKDLPPTPQWPTGWQLGKPDLVVSMPQTYTLPAGGRDIYRHFIIPISMPSSRYVAGLEFKPGNKSVHHAFIRFDRTGESRRLDALDPEPGFPGMDSPETALTPDGQILSWQPGKLPSFGPPGLSWTLERRTDLVLQLHLQTTGKPEPIRSEIAFYFTAQVPTNTPFKIALNSFDIDIPAGATNYVAEDSYVLPVDAEILAVLPHTHYLGKRLEGFATLPDGRRQWLLLIKDWDFRWQGDYRYARPVMLPKGSKISMRFAFDNSTNNTRNPHQPPVRVRYGVQTTDEMAELWLQLLPRNRNDAPILSRDYRKKVYADVLAYDRYRLRLNPDDARAHSRLGQALLAMGQEDEAFQSLQRAVRLDPRDDEAHYFLGIYFRKQTNLTAARVEFEKAIAINSSHAKAHGNLALLLSGAGNFSEAEIHFRDAIRLNPDDALARDEYGVLLLRLGRLVEAEKQLQEASRIDPADEIVRSHLETLAAEKQRRKQ